MKSEIHRVRFIDLCKEMCIALRRLHAIIMVRRNACLPFCMFLFHINILPHLSSRQFVSARVFNDHKKFPVNLRAKKHKKL